MLRCAALALRLAISLCLLVVLGACHHAPKVGFGEVCDGDDACTTGLFCVGDGTSAHSGRCTKSCGPDTACPEGWSCSALTARGVAVCARGSGVPDLQLNGPRP